MDTLQFHFGRSIFQDVSKFETEFWNPDISWKNKYKDYPKDKSPKFPGATTLFVGLTDGWHFFQAVMLFCFLLAIIYYKNHNFFLISLMATIILYGAFSFGFTLMYNLFLI
ncbi:MAG: hypothetical protein KTR26_10680 [Flammeovirgaceae bacterium]|nr:hypothetical protein [Flammeovirgaceae bacterium]